VAIGRSGAWVAAAALAVGCARGSVRDAAVDGPPPDAAAESAGETSPPPDAAVESARETSPPPDAADDASDARDASDASVDAPARDAVGDTAADAGSERPADAGGDAASDGGAVVPPWPQPTQASCPLRATAGPTTYSNPFTLPDEWPMYGVGDPFIFKYLGTYYLYVSTRDNEVGVRCYSSPDLVRWTSRGLCSTDPITKSAYAPEVRYWDGTFYMYTSPAGLGHYVLTATSPTGPFVAATGNLGASIDGSVFVDDNGQWTFLHAGSTGITAHPMPTPLSLGPATVIGGAFLNGWTEGPGMIKRGGIYYLTYTGNHVLDKGYRVAVATSSAGPMTGFSSTGQGNPVVLSAEGDFTGLGHSTNFIGPDLDTYFITYHNKAGDFGVGPYRRLDIDRLAWNGSKMLVLGPTHTPQPVPAMPVFCDDFSAAALGTSWRASGSGTISVAAGAARISTLGNTTPTEILTTFATAAAYTAELNVRQTTAGSTGSARYGAVVGSVDDANAVTILLRSDTNQVETRVASSATPRLAALPAGFDHRSWHQLRVEKSATALRVYVDGMLEQTLDGTLAGAGRIGYVAIDADASFGYVAYSNQVDGSATFDTPKPIPGRIAAVHYGSGGEGVDFHDATAGNTGGGYRADGVDIRASSAGGFQVTATASGEWLRYATNVAAAGAYQIGVRYAAAASASVRLRAGTTDATGVVALPATGGPDALRTFTIPGVMLPAGIGTLTLEIVSGSPELHSLIAVPADVPSTTSGDEFAGTFAAGWSYADGTWTVAGGVATATASAKRAFGPAGVTDLDVSTDVRGTGSYDGGLLLRATNAAVGGAGDDPVAGTDFLQGYFVGLSPTALVLGKQNYDWTQLATATGSFPAGTWTHLAVSIRQDTIQVFVNGATTPAIVYTDPDPFIAGRPGLRVHTGPIDFRHFAVTAR
jgi:hypothetical protein